MFTMSQYFSVVTCTVVVLYYDTAAMKNLLSRLKMAIWNHSIFNTIL